MDLALHLGAFSNCFHRLSTTHAICGVSVKSNILKTKQIISPKEGARSRRSPRLYRQLGLHSQISGIDQRKWRPKVDGHEGFQPLSGSESEVRLIWPKVAGEPVNSETSTISGSLTCSFSLLLSCGRCGGDELLASRMHRL